MTTKDDLELLRLYVTRNSDEAFAELVKRHVGLVYSTAIRRLGGDAHLAEDVTQQVFTDLARKARSLDGHGTLAGWLFVASKSASASVVRGEQRRKSREIESESMRTPNTSHELDLSHLQPVLDEIIAELRAEDREAIVLRFFEQRTFGQIGETLKITEEAARKRLDRTLEKLQALFARRGITSTTAAIAVALGATGLISVPAGLAAKIASSAAGAGVAVGGTSVLGAFLGVAVPTACIVLAGGLLLNGQNETNRNLRAQISKQKVSLQDALDRSEGKKRSAPVAAVESKERQDLRVEVEKLRAALLKPLPAPVRAAPAQVTVTPRGTLRWGDKPVNLEEYLVQTRLFREQSARGESSVGISAYGAKLSQLAWAIDEARKAKVEHIVVDSDAAPDPTLPHSWF